MNRKVLGLCFVVSGATGLIYEVLWVRMLGLVFGATTLAVSTVLVPFLFLWIDRVYALIWQQLHPGQFTFSLWRFLLSGLVLLVPTTLMGATLPVLAAAFVRSSDSNSVTKLYACNLAGA